MGKYISAELYKARHRVYPWAFLGVLLGCISFGIVVIRVNAGPGASAEVMVTGLMFLLSTGLYLVIGVCDIVFSEQYKYNTLKNEVSYGLPRGRIYLGKLITTFLVAVVMCGAIFALYLGLSCALFPLGEGLRGTLETLGRAVVMAFPLWLGGLGFFLMLSFLIRGSTMVTILYVLVMTMGGGFLDLFCEILPKLRPIFTVIQNCLLITPFNQLPYRPMEELLPYAWLLGMTWFILSTLVGLIGFKRREIN